MKPFFTIFLICLLIYFVFIGYKTPDTPVADVWKLPLDTADRQDWSSVFFEHDAAFKTMRSAFGKVKLHYHTGTDIQTNGERGFWDKPGMPIYAVAAGKVVAIEDPLPQRRITIEHKLADGTITWSAYCHIAEERVSVNQIVDTETVIARRMNGAELDQYGWEYNHIHLEILKKLPVYVPDYYSRKTFTCYTETDVDEYFYDPVAFLNFQFASGRFD